MSADTIASVWEVYERDTNRCVAFMDEADARNYDGFENGYDLVTKSTVRVSQGDMKKLMDGECIYLN